MNGKVNDYEKLVSSIQKDVTVLEIDLYNQTGCYGLYRNGKIYIEKTLSTRQKKNILAEEYGHYQTSVGTILVKSQAVPIQKISKLVVRKSATVTKQMVKSNFFTL